MPYGRKLHIPPTNYHFLAAQQEPYKKKGGVSFNENIFGEKKTNKNKNKKQQQENGPLTTTTTTTTNTPPPPKINK